MKKQTSNAVTPAPLARIVRDLIDVGTGKIPHLFMGQCPDSVDGHDQRDKSCRACRVLVRAKFNIANVEVSGGASGRAAREGGTDSDNSRPLH